MRFQYTGGLTSLLTGFFQVESFNCVPTEKFAESDMPFSEFVSKISLESTE